MKKVNRTEHILKNGDKLIIREATIKDASQLRKTVKEYVEESKFIPYTKGEFNLSDQDEENWIKLLSESSNSLLLVAEIDDSIIGNISLNGNNRIMMRHTCSIGLGLLKKWRGLGIGTLLFEKAINWSKNNSDLEILWLEVYATNIGGMKLYQKFGFKEIGKHPDFIKISETEYADNLIMSLKLKQ